MAGIDAARTFIPVSIAILTVSDTRTAAEDKSGDLLEAMIGEAGHTLKVEMRGNFLLNELDDFCDIARTYVLILTHDREYFLSGLAHQRIGGYFLGWRRTDK